jgi:hypothetical protein
LLQITMTTRLRRITLQCSQRGLTDARTFTCQLPSNFKLLTARHITGRYHLAYVASVV